jgi:hypothetical protein
MNITVTLETAKKLKEAGWDKECEFVYSPKGNLYFTNNFDGKVIKIECETPTLQEILEELPGLTMYKSASDNLFTFISNDEMRLPEALVIENESPVEAAALLWIKLKGGSE